MIFALITHAVAFALGAIAAVLVFKKNPAVQAQANDLADKVEAKVEAKVEGK